MLVPVTLVCFIMKRNDYVAKLTRFVINCDPLEASM